MRELIYYIAATLDGFIAHEDGSFDGFTWNEEFIKHVLSEYPETIPAHLKEEGSLNDQNIVFDTVLMGRKTYEVGLEQGISNPYPTLDQYVFSRKMEKSPDENITLISENVIKKVQSLKNKPGKAIWLCGGADLAGQLLAENQIDSLIIKLNPVVFGSGIPLFAGEFEPNALTLSTSKSFDSGHLILCYKVVKPFTTGT